MLHDVKTLHMYNTAKLKLGGFIPLQALTLVGPTSTSPVLDPLAVLHLNN